MIRRGHRVAAGLAGVAASVLVWGCAWDGPTHQRGIETPQPLPADVRAEISDIWTSFTEAFTGRPECIEGAQLWLVADVAGGDARYVVAASRVEIQIPTTPARFRESLAHELAHHVEHRCDEFDVLRDEIHPLLGAERPWAGGEPWEEVPSERWAEAVVELVGVERIRHAESVMVPDVVLDRVAAWARGSGS